MSYGVTKRKMVGAAAKGRHAAVRTAKGEQDGRDRILTAAVQAFSEVGYEGASTAGIARAAGVAQPLVHHHFGSKEGLWRAAIDVVFAKVPTFPSPPEGESLRAALFAIVDAFVVFVAINPQATRIISREGAAPSPRLDYLIDRHLKAPFRSVVGLLRKAQRAGIVSADLPAELCLFLILGAGSHVFDVGAFAHRSVGLDTSRARSREEFSRVLRTVLTQGILAEPGRPSR